MEIFIDPEGEGYNAWNVEIIPTGAWDPFANMPPADVTFEGVWDNVDAYGPLDFGGVYDFGSFRFDPVDWSMIVVDFALDIPDVPPSTILNLEIEPMFTMVDAMSGQLPVSLGGPLVLNVVPEPTTVLLLSFGGMAAVRRRR